MPGDRSSFKWLVTAAVLALVLVAAGAFVTGRTRGQDTEPHRSGATRRPVPSGNQLVAPPLASPPTALAGVVAAATGGEEQSTASLGDPAAGERPSPTSSSDPSAWADPIYNSEDAIHRALALLPEGTQIDGVTARLLDYETFAAWEGSFRRSSPGNAPVWLVGVLAPDMTYGDVMPLLPGLEAVMMKEQAAALADRPVRAGGLYFVFDANAGDMRTMSNLGEEAERSYASLSAIRDIPTTIEPATAMPPVPTSDPAELPDY